MSGTVDITGADSAGRQEKIKSVDGGVVTSPYWNYTVINATGATVVKSSPGIYGGYKILANAGAFTLTVFDNASAASGQNLEATAGISVAAASDGTKQTGFRTVNGITVNMSGDPTDNLIMILWR